MEVSIVSGEFIKPSCETPEHSKTHLLSITDRVITVLAPLIHFYSFGVNAVSTPEPHVDDIINKRLESLKQSLSKTLTSFYPFAGRLSDDKKSIVCSDKGIYFVEAAANSNLSAFLQRSELFHKLIPAGATDNIVGEVQVTRFTCGGMAICTSISHSVIDALSYSFFLRSWAGNANDDGEHHRLPSPNFHSSISFPPSDYSTPSFTTMRMPFLKKGRSATKRVVFDAEAIVSLKARASSSTCNRSPSRVEAVSAFICKAMAAAMKARSGDSKPLYTTYTVNIRRRAVPPIPESWMGNYVGLATAALGIIDQDTELPALVSKTREEINKTYTCDFIKSLQSEPAKLWEVYKEIGKAANGTVEHIAFNSWCNLGFYDADFGWGKPIWIIDPNPGMANQLLEEYVNAVFLTDTRSKNGSVEAWISCHEEEISILEQDKEFIAFATFHSNPIASIKAAVSP